MKFDKAIDLTPVSEEIAHTSDGMAAYAVFRAVVCKADRHMGVAVVMGAVECAMLGLLIGVYQKRITTEQWRKMLSTAGVEWTPTDDEIAEFLKELSRDVGAALVQNGLASTMAGMIPPMPPPTDARLN